MASEWSLDSEYIRLENVLDNENNISGYDIRSIYINWVQYYRYI